MLTSEKREYLQSMATQLRRDVIEMTYKAQSGHPGGSCSLADIMAYLYFNRMRYDVKEPKALKRLSGTRLSRRQAFPRERRCSI